LVHLLSIQNKEHIEDSRENVKVLREEKQRQHWNIRKTLQKRKNKIK
jgi:hypothetical protein